MKPILPLLALLFATSACTAVSQAPLAAPAPLQVAQPPAVDRTAEDQRLMTFLEAAWPEGHNYV